MSENVICIMTANYISHSQYSKTKIFKFNAIISNKLFQFCHNSNITCNPDIIMISQFSSFSKPPNLNSYSYASYFESNSYKKAVVSLD